MKAIVKTKPAPGLDYIDLPDPRPGPGEVKIKIESRPALNDMGTGKHGRIVAYKNDKDFVRLDMPYPMQHYITLPNIDKMSYTSAFVGQVSEIQMPYNTNNAEFGVVSYWDFTK